MEKRVINPWLWQNERSYAQAVEVKHAESTLYVSGQTAIDNNGVSSHEDMTIQLQKSIENLERVFLDAGYELKDIVRLNIYTTSATELMKNFDLVQNWIKRNEIKQASTVLEVKNLFETLTVELEATAVK